LEAFQIRLNEMGDETRIIDDYLPGMQISHCRPAEGNFWVPSLDNGTGWTFTGQLKTKTGQTLQLMIQENMLNVHLSVSNNGPITIGFLDQEQYVEKPLPSELGLFGVLK